MRCGLLVLLVCLFSLLPAGHAVAQQEPTVTFIPSDAARTVTFTRVLFDTWGVNIDVNHTADDTEVFVSVNSLTKLQFVGVRNTVANRLVYLTIRGTTPGTSATTVGSVSANESAGRVHLRSLRTTGDVGAIFVNRILEVRVGGDLTGNVTTIDRADEDEFINAIRVFGAVRGSISVTGNIDDIIVDGAIGTAAQPVSITATQGIRLIRASQVYAAIVANQGGGQFALQRLETTAGPMSGSVQANIIGTGVPGDSVTIAGDLDADIVTTDILCPVTVSGGLPASRRITVNFELRDDQAFDGRLSFGGPLAGLLRIGRLKGEIAIPAQGLTGQIVLNFANNRFDPWTTTDGGVIKVGGVALSPIPFYTNGASAVGGGAVGVTRFRPTDVEPAVDVFGFGLRSHDCFPVNNSEVYGTLPNNSVILRHYGPVEWISSEPTLRRLVVERRLAGGSWEDISATLTYTIAPNGRDLTVSSFTSLAFDNEYDYRITHNGRLRCRSTEVTANVPVPFYIYNVFMR